MEERDTGDGSVAGDPVLDPTGYQRLLLDALGDDDPADAQAGTAGALRDLAVEAGDDLRTAPDPGEWSVLECVGHIVDSELIASVRYRWILAHDRPPLVPYDQDLWVTGLRHREDDPEMLLDVFESLRAANLDLWSRSSDEQRARVGMHAERGPESDDLTFRLAAGHDRIHAGQARRALETIRS
jgi:DinB superfamily